MKQLQRSNNHVVISFLTEYQDQVPEAKSVEAMNQENQQNNNTNSNNNNNRKTTTPEISAYLKTAFWCLDMNALSVSILQPVSYRLPLF